MRVVGRIGVLMLLALAGCATQRVQTGGGLARPLLAPASLGEERSVTQVVRGAFGPREMTMNCVVTVKDGVMTVVGLNAMGVRLFTIRYDGTTTTVDNSLPVPAQLTPERLLADLQLVHWPLRPLQAALRGDGWELSEPAPGTRRRSVAGSKLARESRVRLHLEHRVESNVSSSPLARRGRGRECRWNENSR
jgi:hypothetical protein